MKTKLLICGIGFILITAAVRLTWWARRSAEEANAGLGVLRERHVRLERQLKAAREQAARVGTQRSSNMDEPAQARAVIAAPIPPPETGNPRRLVLDDPRLQVLWLAQGQTRVAREYQPFYAARHLVPDQIEKLQAAMIQRQEQLMDLAGASTTEGPQARDAIETLRTNINADYEAAARSIIGNDGWEELRNYERARPAWALVERLAGAAAVDGVPITAEQAEKMSRAVAAASARFENGGSVELATVAWEKADAVAREVLTPTQFELYWQGLRAESQLDAAIARALAAEKPTNG